MARRPPPRNGAQMEVIYLQVFVSFGLVVGSLLLFAFSTRQRDMDHTDRLALFPLEEETVTQASAPAMNRGSAEGGTRLFNGVPHTPGKES